MHEAKNIILAVLILIGSTNVGFTGLGNDNTWYNGNLPPPPPTPTTSGSSGGKQNNANAAGTGGGLNSQQSAAAAQLGNALGKSLFGQPSGSATTSSGMSQQQIAAQQYNNSGVQYMKWGKYDSAIQQFRKALTLNPGDPTIDANLRRALNHESDGQRIYGSGNQTPAASDNSTYSSDSGANQSGNQTGSGTPSPTASANDTASDQTTGVKGLPGIYLNDTTGNGGNKAYGIPGLPGTYVNGPGDGSGLKPPATASGTTADSQATPTAAAQDSEPVVGLPPAGPPAETAVTKPAIDLGNTGKPDFDGDKGGNKPITGSGGSSPAMPSFNPNSSPVQSGGGQSGGIAQNDNLKDAVANNQSGQKAVNLGGVPSSDAGLTPTTVRTSGSVNNTSAGDQLVSAAAAGQNSGQNFDSGGKYAGSLNMPSGGGTTRDNTQSFEDFQEQTQLKLAENGRDATADKLPALEVNKKIPEAWLKRFKNSYLTNWIEKNIVCAEQPLAWNKYGISGGNTLLITPSIFNALPDDDEKINLLAFELGKVLWNRYSCPEPPQVINNLINNHTIMAQMQSDLQSHNLKNMNDNDGGPSSLGFLFRATLLNAQPKNETWNALRADFIDTLKKNPQCLP